jgi:hypothetical protein
MGGLKHDIHRFEVLIYNWTVNIHIKEMKGRREK